MAAPPGSFAARAAAAHTNVPSTPEQIIQRNASGAAEPKSDVLRHALDATRKAKRGGQTPASTASSTPTQKPGDLRADDPWLENAKSEDDVAKETPVRRSSRPSDGTAPRMRTQRDLQAENESLKNAIFDRNMKLELVSKQNNELKDHLDELEQRIEELEPLEEENHELRDANERLVVKLENLNADFAELQDQNVEILKIQEDSVANMENQAVALQEAAEIIVRLETDNEALVKEVNELKEQAAHAKREAPARIYSVDDSSRPSTSHFDSDYFSQPASPHGKASKESLVAASVSERAKNFLSMKRKSIRSVEDLKKRFSNASLRKVKKRKDSVPDVPQIPDSYQRDPSQARPVSRASSRARTPRRQKANVALTTIDTSASQNTTGTSITPVTYQPSGLRAIYQEPTLFDMDSISPSTQRTPTSTTPASQYTSRLPTRAASITRAASPPRLDIGGVPARGSSRSIHSNASSTASTSFRERVKGKSKERPRNHTSGLDATSTPPRSTYSPAPSQHSHRSQRSQNQPHPPPSHYDASSSEWAHPHHPHNYSTPSYPSTLDSDRDVGDDEQSADVNSPPETFSSPPPHPTPHALPPSLSRHLSLRDRDRDPSRTRDRGRRPSVLSTFTRRDTGADSVSGSVPAPPRRRATQTEKEELESSLSPVEREREQWWKAVGKWGQGEQREM